MTKERFKNKSEKELMSLLKEKRSLLREFRFKISKGKSKDVKKGLRIRHAIARILTEFNMEKNNK